MRVVYVDSQVSHLTGQEEVLGHGDLHVGHLATNETNLLLEGHNDVELRVVDHGTHGADMDSLAVTHLALTPFIVQQVSAYGHQLCLEEVSQFAAELIPPLSEVERLRQVDIVGDVEAEGDGGRAGRADVAIEVDHDAVLPDASLPNMWISLALVAVVDLLARVDELKLELNSVGWDGCRGLNIDGAADGVLSVESARIVFEVDVHGRAVQL